MFKYIVRFLKILVIACLIGVSLRIIEVLFIKEQVKDLAVSNTINEIQHEDNLQIANNEENIVDEKTEKSSNQQIENQENKTTQITNENEQEEKQQVSTKQSETETTKQEVIETKQETPIQTETKTEEKYTEIEVNIAEKKECAGNNHGTEVGNSGKWFNTKDEAIATYKAEIKKWGDKWTDKDNPISDEDYYKNCPYGYEVWTCMYCGKWTLNYYYDN